MVTYGFTYFDSFSEPVLLQSVFKQGGIEYLNFCDNLLEYNRDFRLYITTRLRNPHYLPEIAVKVKKIIFVGMLIRELEVSMGSDAFAGDSS